MHDDGMSYWGVLPGELLRDGEIPSAGKLLYVVLSSMAHSNGYCWPSNAVLGEALALSKRRVTELLSLLGERGYIRLDVLRNEETGQVERRRIYCGLFVAGKGDPSREISRDPPAKNSDTSREKLGGPPAKNTYCYKGRTYKENLKKEHTSIAPSEAERILQAYAGEDAELWNSLAGFLNVRITRKKPLTTARAAHILLNKLDRLSGGRRELKIALLDEAVLHNWESVYPLKGDELPAALGAGVDEEGEMDGI